MASATGSIHSLRPSERKELHKLTTRRLRGNAVVSLEFARLICSLSFSIGRQVGALVDRQGRISSVLVGDTKGIVIPPFERGRSSGLRGLRLIHTHLYQEELTSEDLYDLTLLRLDYITAITMDAAGLPKYFYSARIIPDSQSGYDIEPRRQAGQLPEDFPETIKSLEESIRRQENRLKKSVGRNRALLAGVYIPEQQRRRSPHDSMQELKELCETAGVTVVDTLIQKRSRLDPISLVGSGKAKEIAWRAAQRSADMIVFDLELLPAQARRLSQLCDLKIIDRTQLILDIFACNARSRDGKLQVELAQLRYLRGRLSEKDDNMSRLTGGIGGRGPGETAFEIGRRRVNDRIARLTKELERIKRRRGLNRKRRELLPTVSIVGYTNAGKSTLLNALTRSEVPVANRLFATLDPTTRRLRFPKEREIIIADTVGFIHDLPPDLRRAFEATLEELAHSDLLLHCVDASNPQRLQKVEAVEAILNDMQLGGIPTIRVYNKCDLLDPQESAFLEQQAGEDRNIVMLSAANRLNLDLLLANIETLLFEENHFEENHFEESHSYTKAEPLPPKERQPLHHPQELPPQKLQPEKLLLIKELVEELEDHQTGETWHIPLDHALQIMERGREEYLHYIYSRRREDLDWERSLDSNLGPQNIHLFVDFLEEQGYSEVGPQLQRAGFYMSEAILQEWLEFFQSFLLSALSRHDISQELLEIALAGCQRFEDAANFYCHSSFCWQDSIPSALQIYLQRRGIRDQRFSRATLKQKIEEQFQKGDYFISLLCSEFKERLREKARIWDLLDSELPEEAELPSGELAEALRQLGMSPKRLPDQSQLQSHYRSMLKKYHPDLNSHNRENSGEEARRIIEAYSTVMRAYQR